jgi:translation initiation factor 1
MGEKNIVYSTDPEWKPPCQSCGKTPCACPGAKQNEPVRLSFRRGHKGSGITLIERLQMHPAGKEEMLKKFKKRLGVGGALKQGALELQGDQRDFVETELKSAGYKIRRIG